MTTNLAVLLANDAVAADSDDFAVLWDKIARAEKSYARAESKRQEIVAQFNQEVRPAEEALVSKRYALVDHLIGFVAKKSLSHGQLKHLRNWIEQELDELYDSPFRSHLEFDVLVDRYKSALTRRNPSSETPPSDHESMLDQKAQIFALFSQSGTYIDDDIFDELYAKGGGDQRAFLEAVIEYIDQVGEGSQEQRTDESTQNQRESRNAQDWHDEQHSYEQGSTWSKNSAKLDLSKQTPQAVVTALYKRLAQKLHPDKASDEIDRVKRHELMQILTKAKQEGDLHTLLSLVRAHADPTEVKFSEDQMHLVRMALMQKLNQLQRQRDQLKHEPSIESQIYSRFNGRGQKAIKQKLHLYRDQLARMAQRIESQQESVETFAALRRVLKAQSDRPKFFFM